MERGVAAPRRTAGVRTGGRSERIVAAALAAALAELADVGYASLRLEDVAARAGVAKTTLYRRWPTKAALVRAAIHVAMRADTALPDTGSLRADLLAMLERTTKLMETPEGRAIARLVTIDRADPEVDQLSRTLRDDARERRAAIVIRAQERDELPASADPYLVTEAIWALVMSRLLRFGERLDRASAERLVDLVVTGAEHGGGRRARRRR